MSSSGLGSCVASGGIQTGGLLSSARLEGRVQSHSPEGPREIDCAVPNLAANIRKLRQ